MHKKLISTVLITIISTTLSSADVVTDTLGFGEAIAASPAELLDGKISGLRSASIDGSLGGRHATFIRGLNSLRGINEPLWIVDGAILGDNGGDYSSLSFLNPYDIGEIRIVKNMSEAAMYGEKGANGVIIITTRRMKTEGTSSEWHSNLGLSIPGESGQSFRNAFIHNHSFLVSSVRGQSSFTVSARLKDEKGAVRGTDSRTGGIRVSYDTKANPVVWFGVNTILSFGSLTDQSIGSEAGKPALMMIQRHPDRFPTESVSGWLEDYDNDAGEMRMVTSADLTLNITKSLSLKTIAGADYRNFSSYEWFGNGTSEGLAGNGVASISSDATLRYDLNSTLTFSHHYGDHFLKACAGVELFGDWMRTETMNGRDFFSHELRAKGLNIHADKTSIINNSADYFNRSLLACAEWNWAEKVGANVIFKPGYTPRYGSGSVKYYGISAYTDLRKLSPALQTVFSDLKIRAGYGKGGRAQYVPYEGFGNFLAYDYPDVGKEIQYFYEAINRIQSKEINAGVDLGLANGRFGLSVSGFRKKTDDGFLAYCFGKQGSSGLWHWSDRSDFFDLSSGILSSGVEFDLDASLIESGKTHWSAGANFSYGKTSLENCAQEDESLGKHFGELFPKLYGGFNSILSLGALTFEGRADFASGYSLLNLSDADPAAAASEVAPEDAGYLRLRSLSAAYTFRMKDNAFVKSVRLSLSAFNLLTFSAYDGWNPTVSNLGKDYGSYPIQRSVVAGVKINF